MELREYQKKLIDDIKSLITQGYKSILAVLGCGGGKSVIQAEIVKNSINKGNRVLYLVHRKELCEQIVNTFTLHGVDMKECDVVSIQTYRRNSSSYKIPRLILVDEAHTNLTAYKKVFEENDCIKIGFTATPVRLKEKGLGDLFQVITESVDTQWLIDNKFLSDFKYYSIKLADTSNVKIKAGEYDQAELNDIMENKIIYEDSVKQWIKLAKDKKTMVYCTSIESSQKTAEEFKKNGINAVHLDGKTPKTTRAEIVKYFRLGGIKVLCNAMLFSEGYDDKFIECVMLLRPTMSLALHVQQSMRGMRYLQDKICVIIDCVGNVYKHGLPTEKREWSLNSRQKSEIKIKECINCYAVYRINLNQCPYCGFKPEIIKKESAPKKTINANLVEIDKTFKLQNTKLKDFKGKSWEEVEEFRKAKKYKFMWSIHYALNNGIKIPPKYNKLLRSIRGNDRT